MRVGLFTEFPSPPGMSEATAFDESMAQVKAAEEFGYDAVWLAEIHFQQGRSVLASPLVIASAIAASTRRVRIGIAVHVLPLGHPLHIAEDVATLDHLSKGRLDFGVGRSGLPGHYEGFNIPNAESRDRFRETLEIIVKAWTEDRFSYEGKFYQYHDVCIVPKPYQKPHPPILMAATGEETYAAVGRLGYPLFVAARTTSIHEVKRFLASYHDGWKAAGHPGRGDVSIIVPVYVADTAARAREEPAASTMHFFRSISRALSVTSAAMPLDEARAARAQRLGSLTYEEVLDTQVVYGTAQSVADRLGSLRDEIGFSSLCVWMNVGGLIPHEPTVRSMRLFAEHVIPRLT
jgi:alkanesulfonate monooxygenase SsuD/methylene tetrahydromethanopterin reductase-like flavin-dependent oxidoreductase (luciferase family)